MHEPHPDLQQGNPDAGAAEQRVLRLLAAGTVLPGTELASRAGLSPAALDAALDGLRGQGLELHGSAATPCHLPAALELLDAQAVQAALSAPTRQLLAPLQVLWRPGSTSDAARAMLAHARSPVAVLAESQSQGRGRRGSAWLSPPGCNVYLSLAWPWQGTSRELAGLSLAMGASLCQLLVDLGCADATLKWPNDVLVDGAKLAGVLVELDGPAGGPVGVVIGIGLNLHLPACVRARVGQPATDLTRVLPGRVPSRNRLAANLLDAIVQAMQRFSEFGLAGFLPQHARHDGLRQREVEVRGQGAAWRGRVLGVAPDGGLRVRASDGRIHTLHSADVSVRPQ